MKKNGVIVILLVFVGISLQGMNKQQPKLNETSKKEILDLKQLKEEVHNKRRELPKNKNQMHKSKLINTTSVVIDMKEQQKT